jgi:hypothetical protein
MARKLSPTMSLQEFSNGYWYVDELKDLASQIGISGATRLRKDELEKAIQTYLRSGKTVAPAGRALKKAGTKDLERGLALNLPIRHYTSNRITKDFVVNEAKKLDPHIRVKSGVWYRLNRWRESQLIDGKQLTYGDLVRQFIALNGVERFPRIPHGRYINFVADFLAHEKNASRTNAIAAWKKLKAMNVPKTYDSWRHARNAKAL